ncbi:DUF5926 family protein [Rhodococcus spongiicola]|uniref:DUF5926 domain-containing protein n=1 Tax=Rhodococcus spongiicola TaxID=2487352 RepID=A0A438AU30_9NOCA|nr:DUF5926 family protein [Rhodococcus spongiicola]RVW02263.1 hypothetical protein EF834_11590 [Rhodococcus spongiicola]
MGKKSKRNSGPKPGSNRAAKLEQRRLAREAEVAAPTRPFAGLAAECDLVALREFVPSAIVDLQVREADKPVTGATVLPGAVAALVRDEAGAAGRYVGFQVQAHTADPGADLGAAVVWAQTAEPGTSLTFADPSADGPRLADVLVADALPKITVHQDFDWWIPEGVESTPDVAASVQQANMAIMPSARIEADDVVAAWWVDAGERAHLRWVRPEDEDALMLALARLQAAGGLHLGEGSRFAGSFRTHGLLVPVFDLDREKHPDEWAEPTVELGRRLAEALAVDAPLTSAELRARDGLRGRQVTLR